uniref:Uncharacterized protein n=1 Tax=Sphaerodactylus townsendi TaxID=933632 RepID=A0ACB8F0J7_9SAUR
MRRPGPSYLIGTAAHPWGRLTLQQLYCQKPLVLSGGPQTPNQVLTQVTSEREPHPGATVGLPHNVSQLAHGRPLAFWVPTRLRVQEAPPHDLLAHSCPPQRHISALIDRKICEAEWGVMFLSWRWYPSH